MRTRASVERDLKRRIEKLEQESRSEIITLIFRARGYLKELILGVNPQDSEALELMRRHYGSERTEKIKALVEGEFPAVMEFRRSKGLVP